MQLEAHVLAAAPCVESPRTESTVSRSARTPSGAARRVISRPTISEMTSRMVGVGGVERVDVAAVAHAP